jgi:uncharacterized protein (TIGR04552 family)
MRRLESELQHDQLLERSQERAALAPLNEFSAPEYKIVNFVADLPIRVDEYLSDDVSREFGRVVFVMTEFQLADKSTVTSNELGESSHDAYKARQHRSVRRRLLRGRRPTSGSDMALREGELTDREVLDIEADMDSADVDSDLGSEF